MPDRKESDQTAHSDQQRDELLVVQKSLLFFVKAIGSGVAALIVAGICVGIADHFKLIEVEHSVTTLNVMSGKYGDDYRLHNENVAIWRAGIDVVIVDIKARIMAVEARLTANETDARQARKEKP